MFVSDAFDVNSQGHLTVGEADTLTLAKQYGTPLYVMDGAQVRANCRGFVGSMKRAFGENGRVLFASKAFCCKEMCRIVCEEGLGLDVVSGGELYTADAAGFPMDKICFHGNNKTPAELAMAVEKDVGRIVVDNIEELSALQAAAERAQKTAYVLLRIKPGVEAHTHEFIRTGQIDSKFGFAIETGEADTAVAAAAQYPNVTLMGFHCHIGSQIFEMEPFLSAAEVMLDFILHIKEKTGVEYGELNLGGGFGIRYKETDAAPARQAYLDAIGEEIRTAAAKRNLATPFIYIEPGRAIVGDAGLTLYTVGSVKHIPGVRTYVSVDGGMFDNPRYILYQAEYTVLCADRALAPCDSVVTVAGKCCESGDLIQEHTPLQTVQAGDTLAVLSTGAYNYSMASHYNRNPIPPVVLVENGRSRVIVRGETYADMCARDV